MSAILLKLFGRKKHRLSENSVGSSGSGDSSGSSGSIPESHSVRIESHVWWNDSTGNLVKVGTQVEVPLPPNGIQIPCRKNTGRR